jgi:hypothetical protein
MRVADCKLVQLGQMHEGISNDGATIYSLGVQDRAVRSCMLIDLAIIRDGSPRLDHTSDNMNA